MRRWIALALTIAVVAAIALLWPASSADRAAPIPTAAATPPPAPTAAPRTRVTLHRPRTTATTPNPRAPSPADLEPDDADDAAPEAAPAPRRIDLDGLDPDARQAMISDGLALIGALVDACEDQVDDPLRLAAVVTLDPDGLLEMDLSSYAGDDVATPGPPIPDALLRCVEDTLWDQDWPPAPDGTEVGAQLTVRFEPDP